MFRPGLLVCLLILGGCSDVTTSSGAGGGGGTHGTGGGSGVGGGNGSGGGNTGGEICDNHMDDDGDGKTDCADPDCFGTAQCCLDLCDNNTSICDTGGVRTCAVDPQTGCREFAPAQACNNGLLCSGGTCVSSCSNQCTQGMKQCSSSGSVVECQMLATGCTDWVVTSTCPAGQACSGGQCLPGGMCTNQCTQGATQCTAGGQFQQCVQLMSGCTDWTFPSSCPATQVCDTTTNMCAAPPHCNAGDVRCDPTTPTVQTCDANGAWQSTQQCAQACSMGACTAGATCSPSTVRCNANNVEVCNSTGSAWLFQESCNVGCNGGVCTDPCTAGEKRCNGNNQEVCNTAGTGWSQMQACANGCYLGDCMQADLVIDGVTQTLEGDHAYANSVVVKNGGQLQVGPSGWLKLRAKTISVLDSASNINANQVGDGGSFPTTQVYIYSYCYDPTYGYPCCNNVSSGYTYVTCYGTVATACSGMYSVGEYNPCINQGTSAGDLPPMPDDLGVSEGAASGTYLGGGLVQLVAQSITVNGQITSNAANSSGTGGTVLLAADTLSGNGAIQTSGGITGMVKVLHGSMDGYTGSISSNSAPVVKTVMPPLDLVSGSHPDQSRWYNDGLGDLYLAWSKPFSSLNGYYFHVSQDLTDLPSPSNGTFIQGETQVVKAKDLLEGTNYFNIVSVDSQVNVGTVKARFKVNVNATPPTITSTSHSSERTWYQNNAIYLTWTNPQDDANFTGYYYLFDHYADTVPSATNGNLLTAKQTLLANTADGIWGFHLVNRDTRGATTTTAAHYIVYVGTEPAKENVSGSVFDASNNNAPLSGVTISINRGIFKATSTSSGTYTFGGNVYVGSWDVTASATGYLPQTKSISLTQGNPLNVNFTLTKGP